MGMCTLCDGTGQVSGNRRPDSKNGACPTCLGTGWVHVTHGLTKADRQARTAAQTKCACGNVCSAGMTQCGSCARRDTARDELVEALRGCRDLDDLKHWIESDLIPRLEP